MKFQSWRFAPHSLGPLNRNQRAFFVGEIAMPYRMNHEEQELADSMNINRLIFKNEGMPSQKLLNKMFDVVELLRDIFNEEISISIQPDPDEQKYDLTALVHERLNKEATEELGRIIYQETKVPYFHYARSLDPKTPNIITIYFDNL